VQALDRSLIQETLCRYFLALDDLTDPAAVGACFTDDAVYVSYDHAQGAPVLELRRSELEVVLQAQAEGLGAQRLCHHLTGLVFDELDASTARTRARVLVTLQQPADPAPVVRNTAICHGSWRKTAEGWLLQRWTVYRGLVRASR
jgi:hypothetical protein